jgi:diguanylate cyclase (GGDEF)-like protein
MEHAPKFIRSARVAAVSAMAIGIVGLSGWLFNIAILKSIGADFVAMKANTAICLISLSTALRLQCDLPSRPANAKIAILIAASVAAIALLTLMQSALGVDFGIDQFLFPDNSVLGTGEHPGRMAFATAVCLVLCALALMFKENSRPAQFSTVATLLLASLAVTGYIFETRPLYQIVGYTSMAVHTAVAVLLLGLGIMAARSHRALISVLSSRSGGGNMARTLLMATPVVMLVLNWLILQGEQADIYDTKFAFAVSFISSIFGIAALVAVVSRKLILSEMHRDEIMSELAVLNRDLEKIVEQRTRDLMAVNQKLTLEIAEREQAEQQVRQLSLTDDLTGLLNRRGFLLLAEQAIKTAKRAQADVALIYFDLDGLKFVNDSLGHQAGDRLIASAGQILKTNFRESDLVARIGGDEFTVLAVGGESPKKMLARLQQAVDRFNAENPTLPALAFSQGTVRSFPESDKPLFQLMAEADALMYQEKRIHRQQRQSQGQSSTFH